MTIKIALILSVIIQFITAIIALSLVKRTKNNVAWWLISAGFLLMAFRRVFELLQVYDSDSRLITGFLSSWIGVIISIAMLISLIFIRRIFNLQKQLDEMRKQNESKVLSAVLKTEEKERQDFSKELHDGLGPLLSSVKMAFSAIIKNRNTDRRIISNAGKLIDEAIDTLKEISNKLSPHVLNNFGLNKAVKSFINKLNIANGPTIHFNSNLENKRYSFNIEVVLYRVICELISNTLSHAKAKNIYIDLLEEGQYLDLKYIDDGMGFNEKKLHKDNSGFGLANISSRMKSINGTFDIFTEIGEGIEVTCRINLK